MNITVVENYLNEYGWKFQKTEEDIIVLGFGNGQENFMMVIQLVSPWLRISVPAYMPNPAIEKRLHLYSELLKLNYRSRMARFALDEQNDLTICIDLYVESGFNYIDFETALDTLSYITEVTYPNLMDIIASKGYNNVG